MALKPNTKAIIEYLQDHNDEDLTAQNIAEALGLEKKSVDGSFTAAIQRKNLGFRTPAEIELEDGTHKVVKYLHLNDEGMALDVNAPVIE